MHGVVLAGVDHVGGRAHPQHLMFLGEEAVDLGLGHDLAQPGAHVGEMIGRGCHFHAMTLRIVLRP